MTTNEYVGTRQQSSESVVPSHISDSAQDGSGRFRSWIQSLRRLRNGRSRRARAVRPRPHVRRVDFVERAAMAREMHRL